MFSRAGSLTMGAGKSLGHGLQDYFTLFHLPCRYQLARDELDDAYRSLQQLTHPDRHVEESVGEQRLAMQWTIYINDAYTTLTNPLLRAQYLLELSGGSTTGALPPELLEQQMEWRERADDCGGNVQALQQFSRELQQQQSQLVMALERAFDEEHNLSEAREGVLRLQYSTKLLEDVERRLMDLGA